MPPPPHPLQPPLSPSFILLSPLHCCNFYFYHLRMNYPTPPSCWKLKYLRDFDHDFALSRGKIWLNTFYTLLIMKVLRFYTNYFKSFGAKLMAQQWFLHFFMFEIFLSWFEHCNLIYDTFWNPTSMDNQGERFNTYNVLEGVN